MLPVNSTADHGGAGEHQGPAELMCHSKVQSHQTSVQLGTGTPLASNLQESTEHHTCSVHVSAAVHMT